MKGFSQLTLILLSQLAFSNSLNSLVFDFSDDLKTTLPDDGWVKLSFNVVNYGDNELNVKFSAICIESGRELPYYPQNIRLALKPDVEQSITVFMNNQCGLLDNLSSGQHTRTIQYRFINLDTKEALAFDQQYVIEVPEKERNSGTLSGRLPENPPAETEACITR